MIELICKEETHAIIGAAMEVHKVLGCGFLEPVYQEALEMELVNRRIPFVAQKELPISYQGQLLKRSYIADLVVFDKVIVEIKALGQLTSREEAQLINYLKATGIDVGLLINFGTTELEWKRRVLTSNKPTHP